MLRRLAHALSTLWTVLAVLGLHATPAFAFELQLGREGVETVDGRVAHEDEAVGTGKSGTVAEARRAQRQPHPGQHAPPALPVSTPAATARVVSSSAAIRPTTWMPWETASRARARLMVFLN